MVNSDNSCGMTSSHPYAFYPILPAMCEIEKTLPYYSSLSQRKINHKKSLTRVSSFILHFTYNKAICGLSYSKQTQEAIRSSKKKSLLTRHPQPSLNQRTLLVQLIIDSYVSSHPNFSTNDTFIPYINTNNPKSLYLLGGRSRRSFRLSVVNLFVTFSLSSLVLFISFI